MVNRFIVKKWDKDNLIIKHEARYVARGFSHMSHIPGVDYSSMRVLIQCIIQYELQIH